MTTPWADRLRAAARLGIAPEAFWRLSLAEWRALTEAPPPERLGRSRLAALMDAYPDEAENE
jgi:hypothetical protein